MQAQSLAWMFLLALFVVVGVLGPRRMSRIVRAVDARLPRVQVVRPSARIASIPAGRPIEQIACDARRLAHRFRYVPDRGSFARFEGLRRAYDVVLCEACAALAVDHLLRVLPPGPDLDTERTRVETALDRAGLRLTGRA